MWSLFRGISGNSEEIVIGDKGMADPISTPPVSKAPKLPQVDKQAEIGHRGEALKREQGDGMESGEKAAAERKGPLTPSSAKIRGLSVTSCQGPPSATPRQQQMVQLGESWGPTVTRQQHLSMEKNSTKEPKFVPYEPYKAAITPLKVITHSAKHTQKNSSSGFKKHRLRRSVSSSQSLKQSPSAATLNEDSCRSKSDTGGASSYQQTSSAVEEAPVDPEYVKELKAKLADSEKQLKVQLQVNAEVKKLLVASVGEDIEARVDHLTQDKARLAADIRNYSSKIAKDFEDKEKLSVESELWKAKFLASSVIVDELAGWKASLMHKKDGTDHYIRLLLHERQLLFDSLNKSVETLTSLKLAFDPLSVGTMSKSPSPSLAANLKTVESLSVLGLADLVEATSEELHERLLGRNEPRLKNASQDSAAVTRKMLDTPAEEGLKNAISTSCSNCSAEDYSTQASVAITGAAKPHLAKLTDKLMTPSPTKLRCCTHCQGSIHNV